MSRLSSDLRPSRPSVLFSRTDFYREEFLKQQRYLAQQRQYYSARAIQDAEKAITRILGQLEQLCTRDNADEVVSELLRKIDVLTGLSAWARPKNLH
ncbi:MAG TPA: hypothetical protein VIC33_07365 [Vicinamibacterales bacterium]|jgi:hypothetical protein